MQRLCEKKADSCKPGPCGDNNIEIGGWGSAPRRQSAHSTIGFFFANTGTLLTRFRSNLLVSLVPSPYNPKGGKTDKALEAAAWMQEDRASLYFLLVHHVLKREARPRKRWMQRHGCKRRGLPNIYTSVALSTTGVGMHVLAALSPSSWALVKLNIFTRIRSFSA